MTVDYRCGTGLDCLDCQHSQFVWDEEDDDMRQTGEESYARGNFGDTE